ncbi:hypothetical protein AZL_020450 [Azospirillum sp. B510]|uniref:hypothetical protein n=1 Tax=Azospirillum sp. (strain B510) TaxID=137722 RepID=UPI0001C4C353|nr:hypothetical protein [Azospirillum sp. B510]BAI71468.1 hypothetical protein AZL_008300 [Azospirillum sp. B510]BAI72683.1 hypothetical protein AZL_020450 [Azospirillum sp. B510]
MDVHLYDLVAYHKTTGHQHRWPLCAGSVAYQSRSDDDPACVTWLPLVSQWASVAVRAAADGARAEIDDMGLANVRKDAADDLPRYASVYDITAGAWLRVPLTARPLNVLLTDYLIQSVTERVVATGAPLSTAVTVWRAKAGMIGPDVTTLKLPVYDRQLDFDTPIQPDTAKYAGTGGYEGPAELKNTLRERCFGHCPFAAPTYLGVIDLGSDRGGLLHVWSVNGGLPIEDVPRGWSGGVAVTKTAGNPGSDQFRVDTATGYIHTSVHYDDFRVECKGDKTGGVWRRYIGELIAFLAITHGAIVSAADVSGMDAIPRTVGLYLPAGDGRTHRDAYGKLVGSVPRGRWFIDLADRLVVTRLPRATAAVPTRTYSKTSGATDGLKPVAGNSVTPTKKVTVLYAENPGANGKAAADATAADAALWTQQWRESDSATDPVIAAAYGVSAKTDRVETALTLKADADAEAPLWLAEKAWPPQAYQLKVRDGAPGLWIGGAVTVVDDIAGFEAGGPLVITGRTNRDRGGGATLFVER